MIASSGRLFHDVLGMEKMKKAIHSFPLLLSQDDCLPGCASVAVVEAREKLVEERTRRREEEGVCKNWIHASFHVHCHIQVDRWI